MLHVCIEPPRPPGAPQLSYNSKERVIKAQSLARSGCRTESKKQKAKKELLCGCADVVQPRGEGQQGGFAQKVYGLS